LTLSVELIDFDSGYLVHYIFQFHLFFLYIVSYLISLLQQISSSLFNSCMLTLLIDQTFVKSFGLGMQFHDVGFNLIHGILDSLLLLTRQLDILFCVVERFLQTHQLSGYFLFFCSQLSMEDVKRCFYFAYHS